jgi:endonuclease YncB( thermonuclease family)
MSISWQWPGSTIVRVIDGDSFVARVSRDLGFHGVATFEQKMRLNRINTPPKSTAIGAQATAFVMGNVSNSGGPLVVNIETTGAYKYGDEWMAEVTLPNGVNLSDALVTAGLAQYWSGNGPRPGG